MNCLKPFFCNICNLHLIVVIADYKKLRFAYSHSKSDSAKEVKEVKKDLHTFYVRREREQGRKTFWIVRQSIDSIVSRYAASGRLIANTDPTLQR